MTDILGTLTDSTGTPTGGKLTFLLRSDYVDTTTTPDTVRLRIAHEFTIPSTGVVDIEVPHTETFDTPYRVTFQPTGFTYNLIDIDAIIPNVASIDISVLLPVGVTNATLDTGALRVGQLMLTDPILAPLVKRSSTFTVQVDNQTVGRKYFTPKPFDPGAIINRMVVLGLSGMTGWTFAAGRINSDGSDTELTVASSSSNTQAGRVIVTQNYNISTPSTALGYYVQITPGGGSTALNAAISLNYTETTI